MNIQIISAGAGSGKTYRLTQDLVTELKSGVRAKGIIATTFTKKAAAELQERVRLKLLEQGMQSAADELSAALIGTVHSVGTRILERFAFEAGVSPLLEIIADEDQKLFFHQSLSQVLTEIRVERMNELGDRLGFNKSGYKGPYDWRKDIQNLTEMARANAFTSADLDESRRKSWAAYVDVLPCAEGKQPDKGVGWNNKLAGLVDLAIENLANNSEDSTGVTESGRSYLKEIKQEIGLRNGKLLWYEWAKLGKLKVGAKSRDLVVELSEFAQQVEAHPDFLEDVKAYIDLVFEIVAEAQTEYANYKRKRGLIDYTDMEVQVAKLLERADVQAALREDIDLLLVDEFQDTSPIQLDIFLKISRLAKKAIWVGDPKQSIYGFRGAEPALMRAVLDKTGGVRPENILQHSWRSREDLVFASNAIFMRAFHEIPEAQVVLEPMRKKADEPKNAPLALKHWHFTNEESKRDPGSPWLENCIADQIRITLEQKLLVQPKGETDWRPLRPGDIGILCRNNYTCQKVAEALHNAGLKASIAQTGLLQTLEIRLVLACLKIFLNPSDALSVAELQILAEDKSLLDVIQNRLQFLDEKEEDTSDLQWASDNEFVQAVRYMRSKIEDLSASEVLDMLLAERDIRRLVLRFGDSEQRLANLDVLRQFARQYEDNCQRVHSAASLSGFLLWLNRQEQNDNDGQALTQSDAAVQVMTYHKSKGLEFPFVVCFDLESSLKASVWGANLVNESKEVDLDKVLANRWLRFWVNPFGDQLKNTRLDEVLEQHPISLLKRQEAQEEDARVLYVGLTRARDYLVFPTKKSDTEWLNRVYNQGDEKTPVLDPYSDETPFYYPKNSTLPIFIETETFIKEKEFGCIARQEAAVEFHAPASGRLDILTAKYIDTNSEFFHANASPQSSVPQSFTSPLLLASADTLGLEKAIRHCLASHWTKLSATHQTALCQHQASLCVEDGRKPEVAKALYDTCTNLYAFLEKKYKPTAIFTEIPIHYQAKDRFVIMTLEMLLESKTGTILVTFVGDCDGMRRSKLALSQASNTLAWASLGLKKNDKTFQQVVVFLLDGVLVELQ